MKDSSWSKRHPGKTTIEVIGILPMEMLDRWNNQHFKKRGDSYREFKNSLAQKYIKLVGQHFPEIVKYIDYYEVSTPLATKYFCQYEKGEIYGNAFTPKRMTNNCVDAVSPIKNLYLTGQDTLINGIAGVLASGILTTSRIYPLELVKIFTKYLLSAIQRQKSIESVASSQY